MTSRTLAVLAVCTALLALLVPTAQAETRVGRFGILCDVHGYRVGGSVVVPLRGIAEWLGATVTYKKPAIELRSGKHAAKITLGSKTATVDGRQITLPTAPNVYDGIACVPLRLIEVAFSVGVQYKAGDGDNEVERMAGLPFVQITARGKSGRVIVHATSPSATAGIVKAWESEFRKSGGFGPNGGMWQYGQDWICAANRLLKHGYVWSTSAYGWEPGYPFTSPGGPDGFACQGDNGSIWKRGRDGWRHVGSVGMDVETFDELIRDGVPRDVVAEIRGR